MYVGMNKLSGKSWLESMEDMKSKFWPVYKVCYFSVVLIPVSAL